MKYWAIRLLALADGLWRRLRPRAAALSRLVAGDVAPGSRGMLCVFAHYDRDGVVDDYVLHYLSRLAELDCEIVFVSTAPDLRDEAFGRLAPLCSRILIRANSGYDFASWRDGLATCTDLTRYRRVILANDSVYGPVQALAPIFEKMDRRGAEVWGITDSLRYRRHLQSYFLVLGKRAVASEAFAGFWRDLPDYRFKHVVILRGEVELSQRLARAGLELTALCDYRAVAQRLADEGGLRPTGLHWPGAPVNATHWGWRTLIRDFRCPFLKVQLLRDNPKGVRRVDDWESVLEKVSRFDCDLIRRHLRRMAESGKAAGRPS